MNRYLMTQMRHEWKSNFWFVLELMIVSFAICCLMFFLMLNFKTAMESKGFDSEDVYRMEVKYVGKESPEYVVDGEDPDAADIYDTRTLMARLRNNPLVEAAAFSQNACPYFFNYTGMHLHLIEVEDTLNYYGNYRFASPDIVRVLKIKGSDGQSSDELERMLRNFELLISTDINYDQERSSSDLVGRRVGIGNDSVHSYKVGAMIPQIKRAEFERNHAGMILCGMSEKDAGFGRQYELLLRVKHGEGKKFEEFFRNNTKEFRLRNIYFSKLDSLDDLGRNANRSTSITQRMMIGLGVSLLIIVFLGLLGSFWSRVQQRVSEIAIRKVTGATDRDIFRRLLSEGTLLLVPSLLLGYAAYYVVIKLKMEPEMGLFMDWTSFFIAGLAAAVMMEVMIILGILFPAMKAMKIQPAIALKEE